MVGFSRLILLLVVFIINTINLKDSINGLVSKLSMSALGIYGVLFFGGLQWLYSLAAFVMVSILIPFFYYNVFIRIEYGCKILMGT